MTTYSCTANRPESRYWNMVEMNNCAISDLWKRFCFMYADAVTKYALAICTVGAKTPRDHDGSNAPLKLRTTYGRHADSGLLECDIFGGRGFSVATATPIPALPFSRSRCIPRSGCPGIRPSPAIRTAPGP